MSKFKTGRLDANESALFLRSAEYIIAQTYDVEYPQYKALQLIPISGEGGPGAVAITYRQMDRVGLAKVVNTYSKDFPRVDVRGKEFTQKVQSLGDSFGWNVQEIRSAEMQGLSLDTMRAKAAREAIMAKLNKIAWFGDSEYGLKGLLYHPSVTKAAAATGNWAAATPAQIIADVNAAIQGPNILSKGIEIVDTVLLSIASYSLLATTPYATTAPITLLTQLKEANPGIVFAPIFELAGVTPNPRTGSLTPTNVMITYRRDPSKLFLSIPQDFEQMPPEAQGMEWVVYCHARTAGIIIPRPLSVRITDGL